MSCVISAAVIEIAYVSQSAAGSPCTLVYRGKDRRWKDITRVQQNDKTYQPASGELFKLFIYKPFKRDS